MITAAAPTTTTTKPAVWFSRHPLTEGQRKEIEGLGYVITEAKELASLEIRDYRDANFVMRQLALMKPTAIFGVFTAVILKALFEETSYFGVDIVGMKRPIVVVYSAWNVQRTPEGGKPTFEHKEFLRIGHGALPLTH